MDTSDDYKAIISEEKLCVKHGNVSKLESGKKVYFGDGTEETIDTIIFWTGYKFCYPFFDPEDNIVDFNESEDRGTDFGPLYMKIWSCREPGIMFPGLVYKIFLASCVFERQLMLCAQYIKGQIELPSTQEMLDDYYNEKKRLEGKGTYFAFSKVNWAFKYCEKMAKL